MNEFNSYFNKHRELLCSLFLIAITYAVYFQTTSFEFLYYDDNLYITDNRHVRDGLTLKGINWAFTTTAISNWHPITWLSHMLDVHIWGLRPGGHHLTNILFHVFNALLLFMLFNRMTRCFWQSFLVALLFALHHLHVESVAWIAERKDVLSAFFFFLTILAYLKYVDTPNFKTYVTVLLFFVGGLMAKPMIVTLPFLLLLLDYWPLQRYSPEKLPELIYEKVPLLVFSVLSSIITNCPGERGECHYF